MENSDEWWVDEVCQYLKQENLGDFIPKFSGWYSNLMD